jgi:heptosyltransferase II
MTAKRILVVGPSWVGDAVIAQSLFRQLRADDPTCQLDVLSPAWTEGLLQRMPEVDAVISNPFGHGQLRLSDRYRFARSLRPRQYDQAFVLPNSLKAALIPFLAGIPLRTGFVGEMRYGIVNDARVLDKQQLPLMVERFAILAEPKGQPLRQPVLRPRLAVTPAQRQSVLDKFDLRPGRPVTALCVGAEYGPAKRWPARHFAALARQLAEAGQAVWIIGSPKDAPIADEVEAASRGAAINLCGKTSLADAIDLLACASQVVSNDSGLMHVAAALDKPMAALFGSSSPAFTPPLSDQARVVSLQLACSPCFKRECPLGHFRCMNDLQPAQVMDALQAAAGGQGVVQA